MIAIKLNSPKNGELFFFIDGSDFEKVNKLTWNTHKMQNNKFYVKHDFWEKNIRSSMYLHRYIMDCPDEMVVDHIDGNPLNNCRSNLRICTRRQNLFNSKKLKGSKNKYRGVRKDHNRFHAYIKGDNEKQLYLGSFLTEEEAALKYNEVALRLRGEFAVLSVF